MIIIILVIRTEATADILAIGVIIGMQWEDQGKAVVGGLRADCLATAVSVAC
jgi:xanthine/uracil permease